LEANVWYVKAADSGDERAKQRLAIIQAASSGQPRAPANNNNNNKNTKSKVVKTDKLVKDKDTREKEKEENCVVM